MRQTICAALVATSLCGGSLSFAQLKFGEEPGNVETQTIVIGGGKQIDGPQFQRVVEAYRTATDENAQKT